MALNIAYKSEGNFAFFYVFMVNEITMNILKKFFNLFKTKKIEKPAGRKFGWKKDLHDPRDLKYKVSPPEAPKVLPPLVDLRPKCPPVYDQGDLGSCTANALASAYQFEEMKQGKENFMPSRLFIYYNERAIEGTINEDAGAMIRDGIKTLVDAGVCPETMWMYDPKKFATKPCKCCYKEAQKNQVLQYLRIAQHTLQGVKEALADGYPVTFGFTIYESMMTDQVANTGLVPVPTATDKPIGGHAVKAVGYDDSKECLIVKNSWGTNWGMQGYFYLPYWYITTPNAAADFWVIKLVE
jgi:C1A family cysteine protease